MKEELTKRIKELREFQKEKYMSDNIRQDSKNRLERLEILYNDLVGFDLDD